MADETDPNAGLTDEQKAGAAQAEADAAAAAEAKTNKAPPPVESVKKNGNGKKAGAEVKATPPEEPSPEPVKSDPHYVCLEYFNSFGVEFKQGDRVAGFEGWPEGTLERRVEHGFIKFVSQ